MSARDFTNLSITPFFRLPFHRPVSKNISVLCSSCACAHAKTRKHTRTYKYTHTYTHIHTITHTHKRIHTHTYKYTHIHTHTHNHTHTHTYTHLHTYIHTHKHTFGWTRAHMQLSHTVRGICTAVCLRTLNLAQNKIKDFALNSHTHTHTFIDIDTRQQSFI